MKNGRMNLEEKKKMNGTLEKNEFKAEMNTLKR